MQEFDHKIIHKSRLLVLNKSDVISIVILIAFWFGIMFYGFLDKRLGFSYTDELCAAALALAFLYFKAIKQMRIGFGIAMIFCILASYCIYSFWINSNVAIAIFSDMLIVAKPFIAAYTIWELQPQFSERTYLIFRRNAIFASMIISMVGLLGPNAMYLIFGHPAQLSGAAVASSLLYFLSVRLSKRSLIIHSLIFALGILSFRSKALGVFIFNMAILWGLYNSFVQKSFRLKWRHLASLLPILAGIGYLTREKISTYFIQGLSDLANIREARSALYVTSVRIANDYFPFGSGYASFASWFSGVYYSKLYVKYGLSNVWGLQSTWFDFVSDTYYPQVLGQFGVAGLLLLLTGVFILMRKSYLSYREGDKSLDKAKSLYMIFFILSYFMIESFADSTFVGNRGLFMMMILGVSTSELFKRIPAISISSAVKPLE